MNQSPAGLAATLCDLDSDQAGWAHALARLLEDFDYTAQVGTISSAEPGWYLGDYLAFRPAPAAAAPLGADAERLMAALDSQRMLLDTIEEAGGLATEFGDYGPLGRGCAAILLSRAGEDLGAIVPLAAPPRMSAARKMTRFPLEFIVARLSLSEAERLEPGDMVIATAGPWPTALPGARPTASSAHFHPVTGLLGPALQTTSPHHKEATMVQAFETAELSVPVTLRLPDTVVTASELDKLADGGTLELGPVVEGLTVSLSVGGRSIGDGELIRLGDRFAILLEKPAKSEAQLVDQTSTLDDESGEEI